MLYFVGINKEKFRHSYLLQMQVNAPYQMQRVRILLVIHVYV